MMDNRDKGSIRFDYGFLSNIEPQWKLIIVVLLIGVEISLL